MYLKVLLRTYQVPNEMEQVRKATIGKRINKNAAPAMNLNGLKIQFQSPPIKSVGNDLDIDEIFSGLQRSSSQIPPECDCADRLR